MIERITSNYEREICIRYDAEREELISSGNLKYVSIEKKKITKVAKKMKNTLQDLLNDEIIQPVFSIGKTVNLKEVLLIRRPTKKIRRKKK